MLLSYSISYTFASFLLFSHRPQAVVCITNRFGELALRPLFYFVFDKTDERSVYVIGAKAVYQLLGELFANAAIVF